MGGGKKSFWGAFSPLAPLAPPLPLANSFFSFDIPLTIMNINYAPLLPYAPKKWVLVLPLKGRIGKNLLSEGIEPSTFAYTPALLISTTH